MLILGLVVLLLFAVVQVAVYTYARTVVASAAADGARFGASEGVGPQAGAARADQVMASSLPRAARVPCRGAPDADAATGLLLSTVRCRGSLRLLLFPVIIDVTASALQERAP